MSKTPTLKLAAANEPRVPPTPAYARSVTAPQPLTVAERLLSLHERLLGAAAVDLLLERFLGWTESNGMGDGMAYSNEDHEEITLGQSRHHKATYQLILDSVPLGTLTIMRRERFSETEQMIMERALVCLCHYLKMALDLRSYQREAMHDGLTGLLNRKALDARLAEELNRAQRHGSQLSMMLIDVDHFKDLNDTLGHLTGDHILRTLADIFTAVTRESDLAFRYGGDEFAILLPTTDLASAHCTAERICRRLKDLPPTALSLAHETGEMRPGLSIGIAQYVAGDAGADLIRRADRHLYHAKALGRGTVCVQV